MSSGSINLMLHSLTVAQAIAVLNVVGPGTAVEVHPTPQPAPVLGAVAAAAAPLPVPVLPVPTAAPVLAAAPVPAVTQPAPSPSSNPALQQVQQAVQAFVAQPNKGGPAKVKEILTKYGATKASDLNPGYYAHVLQELAA